MPSSYSDMSIVDLWHGPSNSSAPHWHKGPGNVQHMLDSCALPPHFTTPRSPLRLPTSLVPSHHLHENHENSKTSGSVNTNILATL